MDYQIMNISVACAIGPSVNALKAKLIFPSKTQFLRFIWISSNKIHSKINLLHTLAQTIVK
jgi:hypothetical protein